MLLKETIRQIWIHCNDVNYLIRYLVILEVWLFVGPIGVSMIN